MVIDVNCLAKMIASFLICPQMQGVRIGLVELMASSYVHMYITYIYVCMYGTRD